jgi:hypothetical protein
VESLFIRVCRGWLILATFVIISVASMAAEPNDQILSPQNGARISQEEPKVLLSAKVSSDSARPVNFDVFSVLASPSARPTTQGLISLTLRNDPAFIFSPVARCSRLLYSKAKQLPGRPASRRDLT